MTAANEGASLEAFLEWWLANRAIDPPTNAMIRINGTIAGTILYRDGPFQVELLICQPNSRIVDHRHPNLDSFEVFVSGNIYFRHGGKDLVTADTTALLQLGRSIRVRPNDWHGANIGPSGGTFLSVQKWNGDPTSVYVDWEGPANNIEQEQSRNEALAPKA